MNKRTPAVGIIINNSGGDNMTTPQMNNRKDSKHIEPINTAHSADTSSIPDLASPKNSPFRLSLDEEHRAKEKLRTQDAEKLFASKQLLRESITSLDGGDEVLTRPERTFLERLLESNDAQACLAAHERLMDGNLFFLTLCGGAAGEVNELIPGHGWTAQSSTNLNGAVAQQQMNGDDGGNSDWVHEWVSKGSQESSNSNSKMTVDEVDSKKSDGESAAGDNGEKEKATIDNRGVRTPYELQRSKSSALRLSRLELRRRQSSVGEDNNRLFRAHEAGLTVTPGGSARKALMRMGLPMEKGLHAPLNKPLKNEQNNVGDETNTMLLNSDIEANSNATTIEKSTFEKALAKIDERAIRKIEKKERAKQKEKKLHRTLTPANIANGGCISPLSMNILRQLFASKQLSFHRSSSSYTRFESFLSSTPDTLVGDDSTVGLDVSDKSGDDANNDIFRPTPRPSTTGNHLKNLLINAGFVNEAEESDDEDHVLEAASEDNLDIMSTSTNSVADLMRGGPSFRNVDMFRDIEKVNWETVRDNSSPLVSSLKSSDEMNESISEEAEVSPANSDLGELPNKLPPLSRSGMSSSDCLSQSERKYSSGSHRRRGTTIGIMKDSLSTTGSSPSQRGKYKRSVSWSQMGSQMVFAKEEKDSVPLSRQDSNLSVISFPNLGRAAPIRSDSMASITSPNIPPLRLGVPLRSESTVSISSVLSPVPALSRAVPLRSESFISISSAVPSLARAIPIRSESQVTIATELDDSASLNSMDYMQVKPGRPNGAAWETPKVVTREASFSNYEGMGIEIEEPQVPIDNARKYRSMLSIGSFRSTKSSVSLRAKSPPITSLDDGFIVKNIDFERHSSELLRSLSNEDLYSSHRLETINGDSLRMSNNEQNDTSSVARVCGSPMNGSESWDLESSTSNVATNAWGVTEDEYAVGYGALGLPFKILGTSANDTDCHPHVLSPPLMESLSNFLPTTIAETNYWLRYSLVRDGASLSSLLRQIRGTKHTLIAIETVEGEVFGSFTSSPWRKNWNYYGSGESFLWRMRRSRSEKDIQHSIIDQAKLESELDVFYWTGRNELVQYCTHDMIAVGGGTLGDDNRDDEPDEQRDFPPFSEGFTKAVDSGGFGLALDSDLLRGTSSSCSTFQSPPLSKLHPNSPFEILNMEVYTLTPCINVNHAESLEMKSLFLESYTRDT